MVTPSTDEPPTRRDFEQLSKSVERLTSIIEQFPDKIAALYVRADVYAKDQTIHEHTHAEHEKDITGLQKVLNVGVGFVLAAVGTALLASVLR